MIPLQAAAEPAAMAVVLLGVVMVFVILFSFVWAFGKLREEPKLERDLEEPGRRSA